MQLCFEAFIGLLFDGLHAILPSLAASLNCFLNYAWWEAKHSHRLDLTYLLVGGGVAPASRV